MGAFTCSSQGKAQAPLHQPGCPMSPQSLSTLIHAHLYEFSRVITTGMSAPPMQAVIWAPSRPDTTAIATAGKSRGGGSWGKRQGMVLQLSRQGTGLHSRLHAIQWQAATSAKLSTHSQQPPQQVASHMAARPVCTSCVPRATNTTAAATQPPSMPMLYQFLPAWGRGALVATEPGWSEGVKHGKAGRVGIAAHQTMSAPQMLRGFELSRPCSLPNATAEPVRVTAPMKVPRMVVVMCTPSISCASAVAHRADWAE